MPDRYTLHVADERPSASLGHEGEPPSTHTHTHARARARSIHAWRARALSLAGGYVRQTPPACAGRTAGDSRPDWMDEIRSLIMQVSRRSIQASLPPSKPPSLRPGSLPPSAPAPSLPPPRLPPSLRPGSSVLLSRFTPCLVRCAASGSTAAARCCCVSVRRNRRLGNRSYRSPMAATFATMFGTTTSATACA
jgi:hypothetical protein